jgi:uncharacterized repeat protein (TIGR01451 family)
MMFRCSSGVPVVCLALIATVLAPPGKAVAAPVVYIGPAAPTGVRPVAEQELEVTGGLVRLPVLHGAVALDPRLVLPWLERAGRLALELPGDAVLSGEWRLPHGTLEIRSRGRLAVDGARLHGQGTRLTLQGASVHLLHGARLDLADPAGQGGYVALLASGPGAAGVVEVSSAATIDVSGAAGKGGQIHLAAQRVAARGGLYALGHGRIEVEARARLDFSARADTGGGLIRLDPPNLVIDNFSGTNTGVAVTGGNSDVTPNAPNGQLDAGNLATYLATNDVLVHTNTSFSAGAGLMPDLPATITADNTEGDIAVAAPVVWNSAHSLALVAHDDLFVLAPVQNDGSGNVVGIAGWDGTTTAGLETAGLASSAYGNGTGDAYVVGSPDVTLAPGVAFGSHGGTTALRGRDIMIRGSDSTTTDNDSFAMVGYRVAASGGTASGPILVTATRDISVLGGSGTGVIKFAQIGHGGAVDPVLGLGTSQGDLSGAITVSAAGKLTLAGGSSYSYVQIGHGGEASRGASRGNSSGDIGVTAASIHLDPGSSTAYAQIGHGGKTEILSSSQGNLSGNITVTTTTGDLQLIAQLATAAPGDAQIGHGGVVSTDAAQATPSSIGTQSGTITVNVAGNLSLQGGVGSGWSQIGHGGFIIDRGQTGDATGDVTVTAVGVHLRGGTCTKIFCSAQIGHGGSAFGNEPTKTASEGQLSGFIHVTATGALDLTAGDGEGAFAKIGHGGLLFSFTGTAQLAGATGEIKVGAASVALNGGATADGLAFAQIGHGGGVITIDQLLNQGPLAGAIQVTSASSLDLVAGADTGLGLSDAQIGHGGGSANLAAGTITQSGGTGSVSVTVSGETSLADDASGSKWWIGHRPVVAGTGSSVLLHTETLDFVAGPGPGGATIDNAAFWPRFVVGNDVGGSVTLRVDGPGGNDGDLVNQQPLTVSATNPVQVLTSRSLTLDVGGSVTNSGSASSPFVDLVADNANPASPNFSPSALFKIDATSNVNGPGPVRLFAVQPSQFTQGGYTPPAQAFGVWYGPPASGTPVVGVNFKLKPAAASADLSVTKTGAPNPVTPGNNLVYTITVTNGGPSAAASVSLTDTLAAGTTFVSLPTPGGWSCSTPAVGSGGTVSCTIASLAVGSAVFTLTVKVNPAATAGTTIPNTATAASTTTDPNPGNESGSSATTVGPASADLAVTKTGSPGTVAPGTDLVYTITVHNAGPSSASSVQLSDPLPAGTTFVSLSSPGGWACSTPAMGTNGTVTCSLASFAPGDAVFTLTVHVGATVASGTTITNTATVSSSTADPNPSNNGGTASTAVASIAAIPTLGSAGLAAMTALLGLAAAVALRRRRAAPGGSATR